MSYIEIVKYAAIVAAIIAVLIVLRPTPPSYEKLSAPGHLSELWGRLATLRSEARDSGSAEIRSGAGLRVRYEVLRGDAGDYEHRLYVSAKGGKISSQVAASMGAFVSDALGLAQLAWFRRGAGGDWELGTILSRDEHNRAGQSKLEPMPPEAMAPMLAHAEKQRPQLIALLGRTG